MSSKTEDIAPFRELLQQLMEEEDLTEEQVYNADLTGLYWKLLPDHTLASRAENDAPGHKKIKDRVTLLVATNASGNHKLRLLTIGKSRNPRCFKHVNMDRLRSFTTHRNPHGWTPGL